LTTIVAAQRGRTRDIGYVVLIVLGVWMAAQNVTRVVRNVSEGSVDAGVQDRRALVAAINDCGGSIVSESPLIPVIAGQRPVLLDPFAFHVVALNRPDVERSLIERISRREFTCVVVEQDPTTARGQAWYANVNLTQGVIDSVLRHYQLEQTIAGERFFRTAH